MQASTFGQRDTGLEAAKRVGEGDGRSPPHQARHAPAPTLASTLNGWLDVIAPCPWSAHIGLSAVGAHTAWSDQAVVRIDRQPKAQGKTQAESPARRSAAPPLYTPAERRRRDETRWTLVQAILAPLQFLAFAVSLVMIGRYMLTGQGYGLATASILLKTALLYAIMITGSIWEKAVFGKWLFARAFFWEDMFSMVVLALQTAYLGSLLLGLGSPSQQMMIAVAAYAAYAVNATQFLLKLRAARLEARGADLPGLAA